MLQSERPTDNGPVIGKFITYTFDGRELARTVDLRDNEDRQWILRTIWWAIKTKSSVEVLDIETYDMGDDPDEFVPE